MTKKMLTEIFMSAKEMKSDICVEITIPGQKENEYIINRNSSIDSKLKYYLDNYTEELCHKNNEAIRIVRAFPIDFYMGGN